MPRRGLRNCQAETGTGLAQPNMNTTRPIVSNCPSSRIPGSRIVPTRSTCRSGLSDSRPSLPRRVVAERQRRIAVRRLVQRDRDDRPGPPRSAGRRRICVTPSSAVPFRRERRGRRAAAGAAPPARAPAASAPAPAAETSGTARSTASVSASTPVQCSARSHPAASAACASAPGAPDKARIARSSDTNTP